MYLYDVFVCLVFIYAIHADHHILALTVLEQRQEVQLWKQPDGYSLVLLRDMKSQNCVSGTSCEVGVRRLIVVVDCNQSAQSCRQSFHFKFP